MFRNRWSVAWSISWFVMTLVWGVVVAVAAIDKWPRVPGGYGDVFTLPVFFLTWFTVPVTLIYFGVLFLGWALYKMVRWPHWSMRFDLPGPTIDRATLRRAWRFANTPLFGSTEKQSVVRHL